MYLIQLLDQIQPNFCLYLRLEGVCRIIIPKKWSRVRK